MAGRCLSVAVLVSLLAGCGTLGGGAGSDYRTARSMIAISSPATSGYCEARRVRIVNGSVYLEC